MARTIDDMDRYEIGRLLTDTQACLFFHLGNLIESRRRSEGRFPQDEPCYRLAFVVGEQAGWKNLKVCKAILTAAQAW